MGKETRLMSRQDHWRRVWQHNCKKCQPFWEAHPNFSNWSRTVWLTLGSFPLPFPNQHLVSWGLKPYKCDMDICNHGFGYPAQYSASCDLHTGKTSLGSSQFHSKVIWHCVGFQGHCELEKAIVTLESIKIEKGKCRSTNKDKKDRTNNYLHTSKFCMFACLILSSPLLLMCSIASMNKHTTSCIKTSSY